MEITKELLRALRVEMDAALRAVGDKHGLRLQIGSASFTPLDATFKLKVTQGTVEGAHEVAESVEHKFKTLAFMCGADPNWFGKEVSLRGSRYTVSGILPGRSKNCIQIRRYDGKTFVCPPSTIRAALH